MMATEALDNIHDLAENIVYRKKENAVPYVLLLGSDVTITSQIVHEIVGSDAGEMFFYALNQMPRARRRRELEKLWAKERPNLPAGYRALAMLVKAGYFNPVITLNVDTYLDDALDEVGIKSRERQFVTYGERTEAVRERGTGKRIMQDEASVQDITTALQSLPANKITILRLCGSLSIDEFPLLDDFFYLDSAILEELPRALNRDLVIVGAGEDILEVDDEVYARVSQRGKEAWCVCQAIPSSSILPMAVKLRGGTFIAGEYGTFTQFFVTLEQQLQQINAAISAEAKLASAKEPSTPIPVIVKPTEIIPQYVDLDLTISKGAPGQYPVTIRADRRALDEVMSLDLQSIEFEMMMEELTEGPSQDTLLKFGGQLFRSLFVGKINDVYRDFFGRVSAKGNKLRIRLNVQAPEISALPWEYLYDETADKFFAISDDMLLTRYIPTFDAEAFRPMAVTPPLKVLVVVSNPKDVAQLDTEKELTVIKDALKSLNIEPKIMEHAVYDKLDDELRVYQPHIVHFIGHGAFKHNKGYLVLENEDNYNVLAGDYVLREFFEGINSTKLIILNACEGGMTSSAQAMTGLAPNLVQRGIPAVIAMQYEIPDSTAITFAQEFYEHLAEYEPVDQALSAARRAIHRRVHIFDEGLGDWGIPVLFMGAPDGVIFKKQHDG